MKILLPNEIERRLINALKSAGFLEIGGVLMGERVDDTVFRVVDVTIQKHYGQRNFFFREVKEAVSGLIQFFRRTGKQYQRFNYLGEWHSHPSFSINPSQKDMSSMIEIVIDTGANFAVLLIIKLNAHEMLVGNAFAIFPNQERIACELIFEKEVI